MITDQKALEWIVSIGPRLRPARKDWLALLHHTLDWTCPTPRPFSRRLKKLPRSSLVNLLESVNRWRKLARVDLLDDTSNPLLHLEIINLARLKALQLAENMAHHGTPAEKRRWIIASLKSPSFLKLSAKTSLADECLDRILGLNERKIKAHLTRQKLSTSYEREDIFLDSPPEDLYTPYRILVQVYSKLALRPKQRFVDLGSGLGRVGIVLGLLYPKNTFIGYELMRERHEQALRTATHLGLGKRVRFECGDLSKLELPVADVYYLYNPFSRRTLKRVFQGLYRISEERPKQFRVLMPQVGRPPRLVKREPWLKKIFESETDSTWRAHGYTIFQSR